MKTVAFHPDGAIAILPKKRGLLWMVCRQTGQNSTYSQGVLRAAFQPDMVCQLCARSEGCCGWCVVCRTSDAFQTRWVMSHLREMEIGIRKPLLLEEFGKKLSAAEYGNGSIATKRDPIFQSMYSTIEAALDACAPTLFSFQTIGRKLAP